MSPPLAQSFEFENANVLVVGDIMLDRFRYGSVARISPEAPVPVMHVTSDRAMLGGAGNVLANLASLGCRCDVIAVVGDDEAGRKCQELVAGLGADPALLIGVAGRPTTIKTRMISGSQQLLRCDEGETSPCGDAVDDQIIGQFERIISRYDAVAVSDYAKGVLSTRVLRHVIERCRQMSIPVVVDPKRQDMTLYAGATVIKPNRSELAAAYGCPCSNLAECIPAAERLMSETGAAVLLTLSEQGMALFQPGEAMKHFHATATEVYDVSGAGDTALAVLCAAIGTGIPLSEAVMLSNSGAGSVVRKLGTATLSKLDLRLTLATKGSPAGGAICDKFDAARLVAQWKAEGLRVGFTNGCFDILHAGHIEMLRQAGAQCDRLVVGLNSDASVSRLKGPERPIQPEISRALVLAAIDAVDLVVIFEEDTPLELITMLMPTDLVKGADYREDQVVGAKEVKAAGGRVHLVELVPDLSTTRAVNRIKLGLAEAMQVPPKGRLEKPAAL